MCNTMIKQTMYYCLKSETKNENGIGTMPWFMAMCSTKDKNSWKLFIACCWRTGWKCYLWYCQKTFLFQRWTKTSQYSCQRWYFCIIERQDMKAMSVPTLHISRIRASIYQWMAELIRTTFWHVFAITTLVARWLRFDLRSSSIQILIIKTNISYYEQMIPF